MGKMNYTISGTVLIAIIGLYANMLIAAEPKIPVETGDT